MLAVHIKWALCRFERSGGELVAERRERVVAVVIDEEHAARAGHAAGRLDVAGDALHRDVEHLGVGRAQRVDGESLGEGPAGVVVGILLRIVRGPVLIVEQRVGDARVRLVHADDVTARGKLPNLGGFHRPRRTTIGCSRAPRPASR